MLHRILMEYRAAMKNYYLPPREVKELQTKKLRRTLKFVYQSVPHYRQAFRSMGKTPDDFPTIESFASFPVLTRQQVVDEYPGGITWAGARVGIYRKTGGSSGRKRLSIRWGARYCDVLNAMKWRKVNIARLGYASKVVVFQFPGGLEYNERGSLLSPRTIGNILFGSFSTPFMLPRMSKIQYNDGMLRETARKLAAGRYDVIYMKAPFLRRVGKLINEEGISLTTDTISTGELMSDTGKRDLERYYGCRKVLQGYGANEFGSVGMECPEQTGIHLWSDYFLFEFAKAEGLAESDRAEVYITCFDNEAMPLLRYRIGDIVQLGDGDRCPCGCSFPTVKRIDGRAQDQLVGVDGVRHSPGPIVDYLENVLGLVDYQVRQVGSARLRVTLLEEQDGPGAEARVREFLGGLLGEVSVEFSTWTINDIPQRYRLVVGPEDGRRAETEPVITQPGWVSTRHE